jgi:hypothetical protein
MSKLPGDFGDSEEKFDPAEMQRRIDQMKADGTMRSLESFLQVMGMIREEWHKGRSTKRRRRTRADPTSLPRCGCAAGNAGRAAVGGRDEHEVETGGDGPTGPAV